MDAIDREILTLLQQDGRATMTEIAQKVKLSLSACHRRFRDLQATGVIRGFSADLNHELMGFPFEALVFVTLLESNGKAVLEFEEALAKIPNVVQAHRLFGEPDYQLLVAAKSKLHYQELYDRKLSVLPGAGRLTSTMVMKTVVTHHPPI